MYTFLKVDSWASWCFDIETSVSSATRQDTREGTDEHRHEHITTDFIDGRFTAPLYTLHRHIVTTTNVEGFKQGTKEIEFQLCTAQ